MFVKDFFCRDCKSTYGSTERLQRCRTCGSELYARYDYERLKQNLTKDSLKSRAANIWRYKELLPVENESDIITMGVNGTACLPLRRLNLPLSTGELYLKDDGNMALGTYKSRIASIIMSKAQESGYKTVICNANQVEGYALACYAARCGLGFVFMTPKEKLLPLYEQAILATGAQLFHYSGNMDDANVLAERTAREYGWFHTGLFYEPYRLEASKTVAYEMAESFSWDLPDVIIMSVGNGGGFSGLYKGLRDLQQLGWVSKSLPRLVAVQCEKNDHVAKAFEQRKTHVFSPGEAAESSSKDPDRKIYNDIQGARMVLDGIYKSLGCAISVSEKEIKICRDLLMAREGILAGDNGAMTLAAAIKLSRSGWIGKSQYTMLYNPENGLMSMGRSSIGKAQALSSLEMGGISESAGNRS